MTLKELEEYSVIANQIQSFRHEYIPSFIKGVDTTKSNVQSFNIADSTADTAFEMLEINQFVKDEYKRLCEKLKALNDYINSIDNEVVKAIVIQHCCFGKSYDETAKILNYSSGKCCRKGVGLYKFKSNSLQAAAFLHSFQYDLTGFCRRFF